jgi:hypothetical protein
MVGFSFEISREGYAIFCFSKNSKRKLLGAVYFRFTPFFKGLFYEKK